MGEATGCGDTNIALTGIEIMVEGWAGDKK